MPRLPDPKPGTIAPINAGTETCGPRLAAETSHTVGSELFAPNERKSGLDAACTLPISVSSSTSLCWASAGDDELERPWRNHA